jgi:sarcosine oxidase subunit gamma
MKGSVSMAEIESALIGGHFTAGRHGAGKGAAGVAIAEMKGRDLVQVGAWAETVTAVAGDVGAAIGVPAPAPGGPAVGGGERTAFFVGPDKIWVTAPYADGVGARLAKLWPSARAVVTELGHSRTVLRISGPKARDLIARFLAIDLDFALFPVGRVTAAGLHGLGVMLHHVTSGTYDLYLPRTFALSLAEGILEVAEQWGVEVKG